MKIYKFKANSKARDGVQDRLITRFGLVRNYAVKMMEGYYRLYGKILTAYQLSNHIAKKKRWDGRTSKMEDGLLSLALQEYIAREYKGISKKHSSLWTSASGLVQEDHRTKGMWHEMLGNSILPASALGVCQIIH